LTGSQNGISEYSGFSGADFHAGWKQIFHQAVIAESAFIGGFSEGI
jgi:hypothetical protein